MRKNIYKYILSLLFYCLSTAIFAQTHHYSGIIKDDSTGIGFPFVILEVNDSSYFFSDAEGKFSFSLNTPAKEINLIHPGAAKIKKHSVSNSDSSSMELSLQKIPFPDDLTYTDQATQRIINHVLNQKSNNHPSNHPYHSNIYNKYVVSTAEIPRIKENSIIKKILSFFSIHLSGRSKKDLFIVESASEKNFLNRQNQHEQILGVKSTGLNFPLLYSYIIPLQYSTIYHDYFYIGSDPFVSPLAGNPYKRYAFKSIYELYDGSDTIFVVKFNPLPKKLINQSKGFIFINSKDYSIKYFLATDVFDGNFYFELAQQYKHIEGQAFPNAAITTAIFKKNAPTPMIFTVQGKTYFDTELPGKYVLKKEEYSEIIREYEPDVTKVDEEFWDTKRQIPLTEKEKEAYQVYDSLGSDKKLEKILNVGQHIYFGHIPVGKVNFETSKFINYNQVERARLGVGFHTNESFSRDVMVRSFIGYGLGDKRWKYGLEGSYLLDQNPNNFVSLIYNRELNEAGNVVYPFDIIQYSSERLRNYQLHIMDYERTLKIASGYGPLRYLKTYVALSNTLSRPSYDYSYREHSGPFRFNEFELGIRYAYGEQSIRMGRQIIPASYRYPVCWFLFTKGGEKLFGGAYDYSKYDFKIQHTFRSVGLGTTGIQLIGGITAGGAPYSRLWNGRGALKIPSIVIHNSFETMDYNEFLSDRYLALFLSHNFGKLFSKDINFRPELVISHNMGIGSLKSPDDHKEINFKTMEKGYFESGFFFNKLLVVNISNFKTGLGLGMFFRYGPYAHQHIDKNVFLKMSVLFFL